MDGGEEKAAISIEEIKKAEYLKWGRIYKEAMHGEKSQRTFEPDDSSRKAMDTLTQSDATAVEDFARHVISFVPEEIFQDKRYLPMNRMMIKALVANTFQYADSDKPRNREMYIRALCALSDDNHQYTNQSYPSREDQYTETAITELLAGKFTREHLGNFLIRLTANSMPVSSEYKDDLVRQASGYEAFMTKLHQRLSKSLTIFNENLKRLQPGREKLFSHTVDNAVFVNYIHTIGIYHNDRNLAKNENYGKLKAGGVAFDIDVISGLPLSVIELPADYYEAAKTEIKPIDDPSFIETLSVVHENIHNVNPDRKINNDFDSLINEMLTEAAAKIMVFTSEGQPFFDYPDEYFLGSKEGYWPLVRFAERLCKVGLFTEEEFVEWGFKQDPSGFMKLFEKRVKDLGDSEKVKKVFWAMQLNQLILPKKSGQQEQLFQEFLANPTGFMEREFVKAWEFEGTDGYLGGKYYSLTIFERLREKHQEIGEKEYTALRDPASGIFTDEVVDIFYQVFEDKKAYTYPGTYMKEEVLNQMMDDDATREENKELMRMIAKLMSNRLNYRVTSDMPDREKYNLLKTTTQAIVKVVSDELNEPQLVNSFIKEMIPLWFSGYDDDIQNTEELLLRVKDSIKALTSPVENDKGEWVKPSLDQIMYWGGALEV